MFEKDIYQLIRGLRAHKGNEQEYIQESLRECRKEIRGSDMDQKATALLKLVYLEMFGHDMSWASFNVLEVMSSPRYLHKRVGYLAAAQSFRPETEVLMLAENLLKKDLNSPEKTTMSLPLVTIPHVINPSMANSLLSDLLPRVSHSNPVIRKKTIVTLYRLALVYPETLRPAWPKIKDRLADDTEDPSVTAAIVNVICELGWRRPQDFLPLAPRLFELLTAGGNNWMAIKIIKLFSTLIPLEPRLVKKLLPPLTSIIKTTPAMSLLYECINGIIQGGIMEAAEGTTEGDDIARLCVDKLRAMLVVEGDPNLRYVALLAFAKITSSHSDLVAQHQDVIMECIDDGDISIRTRALDLVVGMVNANNLQPVVNRLMKQLQHARFPSPADDPTKDGLTSSGIVPRADDDEEEMMAATPRPPRPAQDPPLPDDYRVLVIEKILEMSSRDMYANMSDFEWYIEVLVELLKQSPKTGPGGPYGLQQGGPSRDSTQDAISAELQNVAVRVKAVRPEAAAAAQTLLTCEGHDSMSQETGRAGQAVPGPVAFIAGEFVAMLPDAEAVLTALLNASTMKAPDDALASYLQAIPKVFAHLTSNLRNGWTAARRASTVLLAARIVHVLEPLTMHPSLEVQERAVEYLDLVRLASEAVSAQQTEEESGSHVEPPLLLTQAIPSLFPGTELKPVAPGALRKVPQPEDLDLDTPINENLDDLLQQAENETEFIKSNDDVYRFYYEKPSAVTTANSQGLTSAADQLQSMMPDVTRSYQDSDATPLEPEVVARKKAERRERYKDDPYYIDPERPSRIATPVDNILRSTSGDDLNVDDIPVMELHLDSQSARSQHQQPSSSRPIRKSQRQFIITGDETLGADDATSAASMSSSPSKAAPKRPKKSLLGMDSSALSNLTLSDSGPGSRATSQLDFERRQAEEEEMARAIKEVERLRLEMQRAQEAIDAREESTVVKPKKKKKKKVPVDVLEVEGTEHGTVVKKKKKKKREPVVDNAQGEQGEDPIEDSESNLAPKTRRKKKRQVTFEEGDRVDGG